MSTPERKASTEAHNEKVEENAHFAAERGHVATDQ